MNINLKDEKYNAPNLNPIFNGGVAGIAKNVSARIERRKDGENGPLYKIYFTDEKGGELNKGEFDNFEGKSEKALDYFVNGMLHLLKESGLSADSLPKSNYDDPKDLLNDTMRLLAKAMPKNKYNVAVSFGTKTYPKRYLEVNGYWEIMNVDSDRMPNMPKNFLSERPIESGEEEINSKMNEAPFETDGNNVSSEEEIDW